MICIPIPKHTKIILIQITQIHPNNNPKHILYKKYNLFIMKESL